MSGTKPRYYWDTCIYFAWLRQEEAHKEQLPAINDNANENKKKNNTIVTSVITLMEVLENLEPDEERQFQECMRPGAHELKELTMPIARKARFYRGYYLKNLVEGSRLSFPDAIHLATAMLETVDEVHTLDDGKKDKHKFSLLKLDGSVAGDVMKVCKPNFAKSLPLLDYMAKKDYEEKQG